MSINRPLVFVDLDDTLFQTARKMVEGTPRTIATLDVHRQPNGYMSPVQHSFINWLLASADVVPVTARSVEAYRRVKLLFTEGAICSHGGVMLHPDGSLDQDWHARIAEALYAFQDRLPALSEVILQIGKELGHSLRGWVVEEEGARIIFPNPKVRNGLRAGILICIRRSARLTMFALVFCHSVISRGMKRS